MSVSEEKKDILHVEMEEHRISYAGFEYFLNGFAVRCTPTSAPLSPIRSR